MGDTVNERIKVLRTHLNLTQKDFSDRLSLSLLSISRLENLETKPRISTLNAIIDVFSVSREWLLQGVGDMFSDNPEQLTAQVDSIWKDEAYRRSLEEIKRLLEEVTYLREMLKMSVQGTTANFRIVRGDAGIRQLYPTTDVRVPA